MQHPDEESDNHLASNLLLATAPLSQSYALDQATTAILVWPAPRLPYYRLGYSKPQGKHSKQPPKQPTHTLKKADRHIPQATDD